MVNYSGHYIYASKLSTKGDTMNNNENVTLTLTNGTPIDLEVRTGTFADEVIAISPLGKTGVYTFDPGFKATAACESKITYIDGNQGILLHRGYPIEQLAKQCSFMDVSYLLLHSDLPDSGQKSLFIEDIKTHQLVHEQIRQFFNGFRRDAHPMAIMLGVVGALSAFYHDALDLNNAEHRKLAALRLIAKMPTIAAMCHKYANGMAFICPDNELDYASNFLHMMFSNPADKEQAINPILSRAMDIIFILHADHEQNASTSTVRLAGSTGANPFACISAGIGALWGRAHGGANEACLNMLNTIGHEDQIDNYLAKAKDPDDPFRMMGFGHRVYKSYDPRATIMRETCHAVLEEVGALDDPLFKLAMKLEAIALKDDYFIEKNLYPNVDFYSGLTLSALGIPSNMFTVIFALARTAGWIAHWLEMTSTEYPLGRPRQLYTGPAQRDVPQ